MPFKVFVERGNRSEVLLFQGKCSGAGLVARSEQREIAFPLFHFAGDGAQFVVGETSSANAQSNRESLGLGRTIHLSVKFELMFGGSSWFWMARRLITASMAPAAPNE